ncbi:60S ribosomal protein L17 [Toxocara canis]|uniref:60S ribosomal protein L17 n=1 Tax=Toxocara canis TaxID=6265 RepID=A0A0B2UVY2_TOXCA|nr:60S ribosomal protein L17 [Toxocara canis]
MHFKNTHETAQAIKHMPFKRAICILENAKEMNEIVAFRNFNHCVGRKAQVKAWGCTQVRWPKKSAGCKVPLKCVVGPAALTDESTVCCPSFKPYVEFPDALGAVVRKPLQERGYCIKMCTYHIRLGLTLRSYAVSGRLCWRQCSSIASSSDPAHSSVQATANSYDYDATSLRLSANWLSSIGGKLERTKEAIKFAAHCDRVGSVEALRAVVELVKGDTQVAKAHPHRVLYFSIHLALILDELDVAKELFELAPTGVHVLATSLRVQLLSRLGRLNDALMQLEYVLNEDVPRFDVKRKIADEALDELCAAVGIG